MAAVLATGDVSASGTLTLTLTRDQPGGSSVHLVTAGVTVNTALADVPFPSGLPSDSRSGTWQDAAFAGANIPIVGATSTGIGGAGARKTIQLGQTSLRIAGAPLKAGDTVTIVWSASNPTALTVGGVLVAFDNVSLVAGEQYRGGVAPGNFVGVDYTNGDTATTTTTTLNWLSDLGAIDMPYPKLPCRMIVGAAAYPAVSGWTPVNGTKAAEHLSADGNLSVAVHSSAAEALVSIEPGGSWSSPADVLVANYQFGGAVGLQSWQRF